MESNTIYVVVTDTNGNYYKKDWASHAERPFIISYTIEKYACDMKYVIDLEKIISVEIVTEEEYKAKYEIKTTDIEETEHTIDFIF